MRLGIVRGHLTLAPAVESFRGKTLVVVEPVTMENCAQETDWAGAKR